MTEQPTGNPLAEAQATSLDEFFSRKPPFDEGTITGIKIELRKMREKWLAAEAAGASAPKAKRAASAKAPKGVAKISAEDLWGQK